MLPVQKTSKFAKRRRRSHHALKPTQTAQCPNCGEPRLPHAACPNCGFVRSGLSLNLSKDE